MLLVSQGKGDIEYRYIDEITGEKKMSLISLKDGYSVTLTANSDLPLTRTPSNAKYPMHNYFTLNNNKQPILVTEINQQFISDQYKFCIEKKIGSQGYCHSYFLFDYMLNSIKYPLLLDSDAFYSGGLMRDLNDRDIDPIIISALKYAAKNEDPLNDSHTLFAEVK